MNIFYLDEDVDLCAQYHGNTHLIKMVLETAQMLCAAYDPGFAPYRRTHYNHPCTKWVRETKANYLWTCSFAEALLREFEYRRGKKHASTEIVEWCRNNHPLLSLEGDEITTRPQAIPEQYKSSDPVEAYRTYYFYEKFDIAMKFGWEKRGIPEWFANYELTE